MNGVLHLDEAYTFMNGLLYKDEAYTLMNGKLDKAYTLISWPH